MDEKTKKTLRTELRLHAKALQIPSGAADDFINATIKSVEKTFKNKSIITSSDLTRAVSKELKKYHPDLAYVYENRDTII